MNDLIMLAILKVIRDEGPLSLREIVPRVAALARAVPPDASGTFLGWASRPSEYAVGFIRDLLYLNLIVAEDGQHPTADTKLRITPQLSVFQRLFQVSLSELMAQGDSALKVNPIFGRPRTITKASVFVAMPFLKELKSVYTDHILKVTQQLELSCQRGDDLFTTRSIVDDIWSAIYHADICIVDCTGKNPNVFYELGIAHTLGRKSILITQSAEDIPFDIRHIRHIEYQYTPRGMEEFETRLTKTLREELNLDDR